jgi:alpha-mannosidase II
MMPFNGYSISLSCGPDPVVCCQFDFRKLPRLLPGWRAADMPGWLLSILRKYLPGYNQACPSRHQPQDITIENIDERADLIADQWRKKATLFKSNSVLIPLGDDFRWTSFDYSAQKENYDKLIKYINGNPSKYNIEVSYSTLSDYFDAVREEQNHQSVDNFPSLSGDFFTYADKDDNYWSGYYTSRPYHKRLDRTLMQIIRSAEMLHAWSNWSGSDGTNQDSLSLARRALSLFQHHDGITGTAAEHVVLDYAKQMFRAIEAAKNVMQHAVYRLLVDPDVSIIQVYVFTC